MDDIRGKMNMNFEDIFIEPMRKRPILVGIDYQQLSQEDYFFLEFSFSEEEIKEVLWNFEGNQSVDQIGIILVF